MGYRSWDECDSDTAGWCTGSWDTEVGYWSCVRYMLFEFRRRTTGFGIQLTEIQMVEIQVVGSLELV